MLRSRSLTLFAFRLIRHPSHFKPYSKKFIYYIIIGMHLCTGGANGEGWNLKRRNERTNEWKAYGCVHWMPLFGWSVSESLPATFLFPSLFLSPSQSISFCALARPLDINQTLWIFVYCTSYSRAFYTDRTTHLHLFDRSFFRATILRIYKMISMKT